MLTKKTTVRGNAGESTRKMQANRIAVALAILLLIWLALFVYSRNFIINDFNTGRGNIDHILVGPKGVFTLEVKSHRGTVTFENGTLLRDGIEFKKDFLKQAWAESGRCHIGPGNQGFNRMENIRQPATESASH